MDSVKKRKRLHPDLTKLLRHFLKNRYNSYQNKSGYVGSFFPTLKRQDNSTGWLFKPNDLHIL